MEIANRKYDVVGAELTENESLESQKSNIPISKKESSFSSCEDNPCCAQSGAESSPKIGVYNKQRRFRNAWGNLSYANLIAAAILSSPKRKMKLNEIYAWFVANIPYFAQRDDELKSRGWKNSIRHNLSLKREFVRESGDKKAGYWFIDKEAFLQRLHSENRQINDPLYNKDMEQFESFVMKSFSIPDWNDVYMTNNQQNDFKEKNMYFNGYNYQIVNFNDVSSDIHNFPQPSNEVDQNINIDANINVTQSENLSTSHIGSYQSYDITQKNSGLAKVNPFRTINSSEQSNFTYRIGGCDGSMIPISTKFINSNEQKYDKYMIYAPNTLVDGNRLGQLPQIYPQYQNVNGDNINFQQMIFQSNLNQNQYYALSNVGTLRDSNINGYYDNDSAISCLNNRQYSSFPLIMKPTPIAQNFSCPSGYSTEVNKSLVN